MSALYFIHHARVRIPFHLVPCVPSSVWVPLYGMALYLQRPRLHPQSCLSHAMCALSLRPRQSSSSLVTPCNPPVSHRLNLPLNAPEQVANTSCAYATPSLRCSCDECEECEGQSCSRDACRAALNVLTTLLRSQTLAEVSWLILVHADGFAPAQKALPVMVCVYRISAQIVGSDNVHRLFHPHSECVGCYYMPSWDYRPKVCMHGVMRIDVKSVCKHHVGAPAVAMCWMHPKMCILCRTYARSH